MKFYLGTHHPQWLSRTIVSLFVSHRTLRTRKTLPRAWGRWALDSGGFSELSMYGEWRTTEDEYVEAVERYRAEIGNLAWCAPMDWMCEPVMLRKTGLDVRDHQLRTIENYCRLEQRGLPVIPVVQGWSLADYSWCVQEYAKWGVILENRMTVGLGSICRRQATSEINEIVRVMALSFRLKIHAFGVKTLGLDLYGRHLSSCDSMAWSYHARRRAPLHGHEGHRNCANCMQYALLWRADLLRRAA